MKSFMRTLIFTLIISLFSSVMAADKTGQYSIKGIGNTSCAQFISETQSNSQSVYLYVGWINGYLTAQNQHMLDNFDLTSWENIHTLGDYIKNYCKAKPKHSFYIATASMVDGLYKDRLRQASQILTIGEAEDRIVIYESTFRRVQKKLKELGLYSGAVDGKYGNNTANSIKLFQKKQGLVESGVPDQRTLHAFFRK